MQGPHQAFDTSIRIAAARGVIKRGRLAERAYGRVKEQLIERRKVQEDGPARHIGRGRDLGDRWRPAARHQRDGGVHDGLSRAAFLRDSFASSRWRDSGPGGFDRHQ